MPQNRLCDHDTLLAPFFSMIARLAIYNCQRERLVFVIPFIPFHAFIIQQ
jgi:hypothetical protein